jgi:hypothetical protein
VILSESDFLCFSLSASRPTTGCSLWSPENPSEIDKSSNGKPAKKSSGLWFENRSIVIPVERIETTPRIGVEYSGDWSRVPYRFILRE